MSDTDPYAPVLPRAVREQVERANALAREAGVANVPPAPEGSEAPEDRTTEATPVTPGVTLGEPEIPAEFQGGEVDTGAGAGAGAGAAPATIDWEQRYNTLQGKYNSEVPELRGELR